MPQLNGHQPDANYAGANHGPNSANYGYWAQYRDNPYRDNLWYEGPPPSAAVGYHLYAYQSAPLVDVSFSEELGGTIHLSNKPEYRLPLFRKCTTHAFPSWPVPRRVQHTTGLRTFSLRLCYLHIIRTVCLTMPAPQDLPNNGVRDRPPMPDVADAFSRSVPESAPSGMLAMESLKRLSDRYLHDPGSRVGALRMGLSPSGGRLRVMIVLDIDI